MSLKIKKYFFFESSYFEKEYKNYKYIESENSDKFNEAITSGNSGNIINNEIILVSKKLITRREEEIKKDDEIFDEISGEISKEKLEKIFIRIEDYCSNVLSDNIKEAQLEIQTDIRKYEFGSYDKFRWFLLYKDIKDEIQQKLKK